MLRQWNYYSQLLEEAEQYKVEEEACGGFETKRPVYTGIKDNYHDEEIYGLALFRSYMLIAVEPLQRNSIRCICYNYHVEL